MVVKNVIKGHMAHDEIERLIIIDPGTDDIAIYAGTLEKYMNPCDTMYTIQATDGARTQEKRLNCTESEARKRMQEYFENDYLGLDYFLYDANDNEIMRLEQ